MAFIQGFGQNILDVTKHFARGLEYGSTHNDNIKLFLEYAEFISRSLKKTPQLHFYFQSVLINFVSAGRRKSHIIQYILQANKVLIKFYFLCIEVGFSHYDQKLDLFGQELKNLVVFYRKLMILYNQDTNYANLI